MAKQIPSHYYKNIETIHSYDISLATRELYLIDHFDHNEEPGIDFKMAAVFIKNFRYLESKGSDPIFIHMHNCGGEVMDGMAIYDTINNSKCYVSILAYKHACSMASVIFQAADNRVLMPSAGLMLHYGQADNSGNYLEARSNQIEHDKFIKFMVDLYASKISANKDWSHKRSVNFVKKNLNNKSDWWIDSAEAIELNFADGIFGTKGFDNIQSIQST